MGAIAPGWDIHVRSDNPKLELASLNCNFAFLLKN